MTNPTTVELSKDFSEPGAEAVPWAEVERVLDTSEMFWLSTVRANGKPHTTPLPTVYYRGRLHFCSGELEQKTKNLQRNPDVVLATGTPALKGGLDVVVEGTVDPVTDVESLTELAALWKSKLDWDYELREGGFDDGAGHNGLVFAVDAGKVLSFGKGPYTQTRYTWTS